MNSSLMGILGLGWGGLEKEAARPGLISTLDGLWKGQTDEGEIGATYEQMDAILEGLITHGRKYDIVQEYVARAQHKKKMPPVCKIRRLIRK